MSRKMTEKDWKTFKFFKPEEFACPCGCNSEPEMDYYLIRTLYKIRAHYGKPMYITSGYRCQKLNDRTPGSIKTSRHVKLKAADFYIPGVTDTVKGREEVVKYARKWKHYKYAYHNKNGKFPNMGNAVHVEVD